MKRIFLIAAITVAACSFVFGQSKDEQAIRQTLNENVAAVKNKDVDALSRLYADDYTFINRDGVMFDKTQRLADIKSRNPLESLAYENIKVRFYGNTAVVNMTVNVKQVGGDAFADLATMILIKNGGRWQIVAAQGTLAAANQSGASSEQTLNQFMDNYLAAVRKNSADAVEPFLDSQYIRIAADGSILNKEQILAAFRSGDLKYDSVTAAGRTWRMFGSDTAIVTSRATIKASKKGQDIGGSYRVTTVLKRTGNSWALVSTQFSNLAGK